MSDLLLIICVRYSKAFNLTQRLRTLKRKKHQRECKRELARENDQTH